jgi:hypothetical protein
VPQQSCRFERRESEEECSGKKTALQSALPFQGSTSECAALFSLLFVFFPLLFPFTIKPSHGRAPGLPGAHHFERWRAGRGAAAAAAAAAAGAAAAREAGARIGNENALVGIRSDADHCWRAPRRAAASPSPRRHRGDLGRRARAPREAHGVDVARREQPGAAEDEVDPRFRQPLFDDESSDAALDARLRRRQALLRGRPQRLVGGLRGGPAAPARNPHRRQGQPEDASGTHRQGGHGPDGGGTRRLASPGVLVLIVCFEVSSAKIGSREARRESGRDEEPSSQSFASDLARYLKTRRLVPRWPASPRLSPAIPICLDAAPMRAIRGGVRASSTAERLSTPAAKRLTSDTLTGRRSFVALSGEIFRGRTRFFFRSYLEDQQALANALFFSLSLSLFPPLLLLPSPRETFFGLLISFRRAPDFFFFGCSQKKINIKKNQKPHTKTLSLSLRDSTTAPRSASSATP